MALNKGDWIQFVAKALDPFTYRPLDPMPEKGTVAMWAPGKRYQTDEPDYGPYTMQRLDDRGLFIHNQDTEAFSLGRWIYRITLSTGAVRSIEYGAFHLEA